MNFAPGSIDLHSHSTASDGGLSPTALINRAVNAGVHVLALTDHDTTDGLFEARQAANSCGLKLINGVEISVRWQKRTLHIVGLGVDTASESLCAGLKILQSIRIDRAERINARLEKAGLQDALEKAMLIAQDGQVTRTHFAQALVEAGRCKDMKQAFKRYLSAGKPGYVSAEWAPMEDAIGWIHSAGGVAVLAHPMLYNMSAAWRQRMLAAFTETGGDAVEICCGSSNAQQIQQSAKEAVTHGLLGSAGSDFHHPEQRWIKLGGLAPLPASVTPVWTHPRLATLLQ